jgi:ABC-type sugar transport system ATPase subunit
MVWSPAADDRAMRHVRAFGPTVTSAVLRTADWRTSHSSARRAAALHDLKQRGDVAIIIAHNYALALGVADRVNILQQGRITFGKPAAETSVAELTDLMTADHRTGRRRPPPPPRSA